MKNILIVTLTALILTILFVSYKPSAKSSVKMYGEYTAEKSLAAKFVQIEPMSVKDFNYKDVKIETLGYSEIRVFAHLSSNESTLQDNSVLKVIIFHEMTGFGIPRIESSFKKEYEKHIDGWVTEKIFGRKTKLAIDADNIPKGDYTLHLSYYLLP